MQKSHKSSLLLLAVLLIMLIFTSSACAAEMNNSVNDVAVFNDESISLENVNSDVISSDAGNYELQSDAGSNAAGISDENNKTDKLNENNNEAYAIGDVVPPVVEVDSGTVSGGVDLIAVNPNAVSGTLNYTVPEGVTNIKSAFVIVNIYSGSGKSTYALYSNVTLNTTKGNDVLGYETLKYIDDADLTNDHTVYGINDHATKQYSDYEMVYNIIDNVRDLKSGDTITVSVENSAYPNKTFDGRIKLIGLFFAYDDGDDDNFTYWFNAGQLWTKTTANFTFNTRDYKGKSDDVSLRTVALSSSLAKTYKLNGAEITPDTVVPGTFTFRDATFNNVGSAFIRGNDTEFWLETTGSSHKISIALLLINESSQKSLNEVYVNYETGADTNDGASAESAFKTIAHALDVVPDNGIIHIAGVNYLDDVAADGLTIDKNLTIIGSNGSVIDARDKSRIFTIGNCTVAISGLVFKNADAVNATDKRGGALYVNGTTLNIDGCVFVNNTVGGKSYGGAINLKSSTTTIKDTIFYSNSAWYTGAGINAENTNALLNITGSVFINNTILNNGWSAGAAISSYNTVIINQSVFYGNRLTDASKYGKSINQYSTGSLTVSNSVLLDGEYGVWIATGPADLENNWWGNNDTTKDVNPKDLGYTNANVTSFSYLNVSAEGDLKVGKSIPVTVKLVSNDEIGDIVGFVKSNQGTFDNDTVLLINGEDTVMYTSNTTGINVITARVFTITDELQLDFEESIGEVYVNYQTGSDDNEGTSADKAFKSIAHALDVVENDGIIHIDGMNYLDNVSAEGLTVDKNISIIGGEIAVIDAQGESRIFNIKNNTVTLSNLTFINGNADNASDKRGGALYVNGTTLNINDCVFANNTVSVKSSYGGAINLKSSSTTIKDTIFYSNSAWSTGAGINAENTNVLLNITDCMFLNNTLLNNGWSAGAAICSYNTVIINGSLFRGNKLTDTSRNGKSINQYSTGSLTITNSILLDGEKGVWIATGPTNLENNWWGNNNTDSDVNPKDLGYTNANVSSYFVLSSSMATEDIHKGQVVPIITTLGTEDGQAANLIKLPAYLTANIGSVDSKLTFITDQLSAEYTANESGDAVVCVNVLGIKNEFQFNVNETAIDISITKVTTPWSQGIYAGLNNTFTVVVNNGDNNTFENLTLSLYDNKTGELIANYDIGTLKAGESTFTILDSTVRPITEDTVWPRAQNNTLGFIINLEYGSVILDSISFSKILAYDGYLNKSYAYNGHENIINRNYTVSGDIIVDTQNITSYKDKSATFRNETWNISTPEGAKIVKAFLYFNYNWDSSYYPEGWTLKFNDAELVGKHITYEMDRGNLGSYGANNYGLVVFDVTDYYKANEINSFVIEKTGVCALYPSTLVVLYNMTTSKQVKDIYFSDICDVFYPYYNKLGYDDLMKTGVSFSNIDVNNITSAVWYAFAGSGGIGDADLSFNNMTVKDAFTNQSSNDCYPYIADVTDVIAQNNEAWFITSNKSSTVVAFEQILVVTKSAETEKGLIIPENITPGETSQISLVLDKDATGNVTMYVGGKEYPAEIKDGVATAVVDALSAGNHTIVAVYSGDETHEAETVIGIVEVTKIKPSLVIEGDFDNLTAGDNLTFIIIVPDDATGYILADFDGYHSFKEIEDGKVTVSIFDLKAGEKNITVKYIGNDKYEEADNFTSFSVGKNQEYDMNISAEGDSYKAVVDVALPDDATGEVTVSDDKGNNYTAPVKDGEENKTINTPKADRIVTVLTADKLAMISGDDSKFTAKLTDADGRPLSGKALKLTIVGKTYTAITNGEGVAQWPIGLKPGIYPASVIFNGDADYNASNNVSTSAEILSSTRLDQNMDLVKDYHDDAKPFTVRALDKFGKPAGAGQYVKISVSGKTYTLKTNSKGIATLPINLYPGTYKITSEYAGCKVSNIITVKEVLSAYNRQYARASSYKFSATLKHSDGKVMSNQKLTFTIKGKTYTAVTNAKGEATVTINQALKAGKYTLQVKYIQHFITRSITVK